MLLKDFEDTLKNIEQDRMLMSYGNNQETVNSILSIVNMVQSAQNLVRTDRSNDMFSMSVSSKLMELENVIVTLGYQRLMERGINVGANMRQQFNPMMPSMPMYNQPMNYPNMPMYQPQPQQMYMPQQQQFDPQYSQPMPQQQPQYAPMPPQQAQTVAPQQAAPVQQAAAPAPAPKPQPAPAPAPAPKPVVNTAPKPAASSSSSGGLPGMGGGSDEKAAVGRDFLLKLLEDKG